MCKFTCTSGDDEKLNEEVDGRDRVKDGHRGFVLFIKEDYLIMYESMKGEKPHRSSNISGR